MNRISISTAKTSQGQEYLEVELEYEPAQHIHIDMRMSIDRMDWSESIGHVQAELWEAAIRELQALIAALRQGAGVPGQS